MTGFVRNVTVVLVIACGAGCATVPRDDSGAVALRLRNELRGVGADYRSPAEFRSFSDTVTRAEVLATTGRGAEAGKVFRLAVLKGRMLMTEAASKPPLPVTPADRGSETPQARRGAGHPVVAAPPKHAVVGAARAALTPSERESPAAAPAVRVPSSPPVLHRRPAPSPASKPAPKASPGERFMAADDGVDTLPADERSRIVGTRSAYLVRKGDSLTRIGARLGVDWRQLARINGIDPDGMLRTGQLLYYDNHRIVPKRVRDGIVINIPDRTLYLFKGGKVRRSYPVTLGRPQRPDDEPQWKTPIGRFTITAKEKDPAWRVPTSIQEEMERKGEEVVKEVPPGDDNPLGKYALRTTFPGIMIHSTIAPASIYSFSSHGCIRVSPDNMEELFRSVSVRTPGEIVYQPVKLFVSHTGRVFLEVHRDIYGVYRGDLPGVARRLIRHENVAGRVDWHLVERALKNSSGIPEEITRDATDHRKSAVGHASGHLSRHARSGASDDS